MAWYALGFREVAGPDSPVAAAAIENRRWEMPFVEMKVDKEEGPFVVATR
jgi:hypothetical protein